MSDEPSAARDSFAAALAQFHVHPIDYAATLATVGLWMPSFGTTINVFAGLALAVWWAFRVRNVILRGRSEQLQDKLKIELLRRQLEKAGRP
jgi:hypothetical protein